MKEVDAVWPKRLKFLRKSNNLSQTDVAEVLHCSQAAYGMYELGKRKISADKLLILAQWVGIFLTTFSTILTNLLAGLFFFVALTSWVMKLADGGEVLKMLITAFVVFVLPYIAIAAIAKISFFADELRDFLQS